MDTLIGLGKAGCNIVKAFSKYPQYGCYYVDSDHRNENKFFLVEKQKGVEEYEMNCADFGSFFEDVTDDILLVVGGSGAISGLSLRLLEQLKDKQVNVLYIQPDLQLLSDIGSKQEKIVYNVLQEYARSGLLDRVYLVSNPLLENIIGKISVLNYNDQLNHMIVSTMHMINVLGHIDPIMDTFSQTPDIARISTFGVVDIKENEQKLFFPLDNAGEFRYYYSINRKQLEEEGDFLSNVKKNIKENHSDKIRATYGIYSNEYDQNYGYVVAYSSQIQK